MSQEQQPLTTTEFTAALNTTYDTALTFLREAEMGIGRKTTSPLYEGLAKLLHDAPAKLRKFLDLESYLGPKDIDGVPVRAAKIRLLKANITYSKSEGQCIKIS